MAKYLEKIVDMFRRDSIVIEEWTETLDPKSEKGYIAFVVNSIRCEYPQVKVLSVKPKRKIESNLCPELAFIGYSIRITPNVDPAALKRTCMRLEHDDIGVRVADLDIYYHGRKISRQDL